MKKISMDKILNLSCGPPGELCISATFFDTKRTKCPPPFSASSFLQWGSAMRAKTASCIPAQMPPACGTADEKDTQEQCDKNQYDEEIKKPNQIQKVPSGQHCQSQKSRCVDYLYPGFQIQPGTSFHFLAAINKSNISPFYVILAYFPMRGKAEERVKQKILTTFLSRPWFCRHGGEFRSPFKGSRKAVLPG